LCISDFDFILYYNLLLCFIPPEMHVRLICAIKFYLLTYLLTLVTCGERQTWQRHVVNAAWLATTDSSSTHHSHDPSPPHSFTPRLKPSFSANPSHRIVFPFFFMTDSTDSPDCLPILLSIGLSAFYCFLFWLRDPFSRFCTIPAHEKQTERQIETDRIAVTISHCRFMCSSCYGARLSGVVGINDIDDVLQIAWRHQCTPCTIKNGTDTYSILTYLNVNRFSKLFYHWKGN